MEIKKKLRQLLDQRGRGSRAELAAYLGVPRNYITRWEKYGEYKPPIEKLVKIAKFLGVSTDYLLDDDQATPVARYVPLVGGAGGGAASGYHYNYLESGKDVVAVPGGVCGRRSYAVLAEGDAMEPKISHGDVVVCNPDIDVRNGDIVHYAVNGESGIRIYEPHDDFLKLFGINRASPPLFFKVNEIETISLARCVYLLSRLQESSSDGGGAWR